MQATRRADDVADAKQGRNRLQCRRHAFEPVERPAGDIFPKLNRRLRNLIDKRDSKANEDGFGDGPPVSPTISTSAQRGALGVNKLAVLLDDERPAERNHHQNAEQAAQHRDDQDPRDFQLESEDHHGGHGHAHAESDRLAGRAGGLDDVVLQDASPGERRTCGKTRETA